MILNLLRSKKIKKRFSFVSNSSSTSFCIVGVIFPAYGDENDYKQCHKGILKIYKDYKKENKEEDFDDYLYKKINDKECKLILHRGIENYSDEENILGFDIETIEDNQTYLEFKQQICKHLNICFNLEGDDVFKCKDINIYVDGGYDG